MNTTSRPRRDFAALESRRMTAASLFAEGHNQAEVVRQLSVSRQTASRWHTAWKQTGENGLKGAGRAGRKPRLNSTSCQNIASALLKGPLVWGFSTELWTLDRVVQVIWKTCRVRYSRPQAWRILGQLGWSRQRPMRRAKERDEPAIKRWVRDRWPRVKKTPCA
jgi:transposase